MRALALTVRRSAGPNESIKILRDAIRIGERHHLGRCLAEARMTYAALLADIGRIPAALAECDRAAEVLKGKDAGPLLAQRALILARAGRSEEAMSNFARALPLLRAANDVRFPMPALHQPQQPARLPRTTARPPSAIFKVGSHWRRHTVCTTESSSCRRTSASSRSVVATFLRRYGFSPKRLREPARRQG